MVYTDNSQQLRAQITYLQKKLVDHLNSHSKKKDTKYNKYNRRMDRVLKRGFCEYPGKKKTILQMERKHVNIYSHWRTFSNKVKNNKNLFGRGLKCCVDKHLGIRLEEEGVGMFVDKVCYRYRTRNRGEHPIVFSYPLKEVRTRVVLDAKKRRIKNKKTYTILR
ncbi:hypothetical protein LCGC14_2778650, partial [marine sediment metagenome]